VSDTRFEESKKKGDFMFKKLVKFTYVRYIYPQVLVYVRQTETKIDDQALDKIHGLIMAALS
jgi:hypothetical protein